MLNRTRTIAACAAAAAAAGLAVSLAAPALAASTVAGPHGRLRFASNDPAIGRVTAAPTNNRTFAGTRPRYLRDRQPW
jgi:cobalamin biosynthesis protein CbiD